MQIETKQLKLQSALDEIDDYAILFLDRQGNIETWNKGAEKIKGYKAREIIGESFTRFYTAADREAGLPLQLLAEAVQNGRAHHEGWRVRKDQTTFWGSVTITALHDKLGAVTGFVKITRDLTERMLSEAVIKQHVHDLLLKNKELEQFVYIASHDLQEPLITITNFIELFISEYQDQFDEGASTYLDFISKAADRMKNLIKGLLDYSRIGKEILQTKVDCQALLDTLQLDLAGSIKAAGARLQYSGLPTITAYATELRQLFQNLIANAIKFHQKDVSPQISISATQDDKEWRFAVSDNGIGIDPRFKDKIFLIFQRLHTRDVYEGNGIGLAHCKKIIEMHGGELTVESEMGKGSTFYFTIPVNQI